MKSRSHHKDTKTRRTYRAILCAFVSSWLILGSGLCDAYTGRHAVLYARGEALLAQNIPYVWGKTDCSGMAWKLLRDLWPELTITKWFHRDRAVAMATWPWPPVMSLQDTVFGDVLFANGDDSNPATWSLKKQHTISHVMMSWDAPGVAVHAGKSRGFSRTNIRPYWEPRINLAIRPPY